MTPSPTTARSNAAPPPEPLDTTLREASRDDAPTIAQIILAAFAEHAEVRPPLSALKETSESVATRFAMDRAFIAEVGSLPVGSLFYTLHPDHVYLSRIAVLPAYQGRGIARALIAAAEARGLDAGKTLARLGTRTPAAKNIAFYERLGYRIYARTTHEGWTEPTTVQMEKRL